MAHLLPINQPLPLYSFIINYISRGAPKFKCIIVIIVVKVAFHSSYSARDDRTDGPNSRERLVIHTSLYERINSKGTYRSIARTSMTRGRIAPYGDTRTVSTFDTLLRPLRGFCIVAQMRNGVESRAREYIRERFLHKTRLQKTTSSTSTGLFISQVLAA